MVVVFVCYLFGVAADVGGGSSGWLALLVLVG